MVRIISQENSTWQGQVTWLDGEQTESFRSMLELIKLMDAVIEKKDSRKKAAYRAAEQV